MEINFRFGLTQRIITGLATAAVSSSKLACTRGALRVGWYEGSINVISGGSGFGLSVIGSLRSDVPDHLRQPPYSRSSTQSESVASD